MNTIESNTNEEKRSLSFVEQIVEEDIAEGKNGGRIQTRFPPEPNGYLHIGHAKAICMDFGVAEKYNGVCNLRFDDTNPSKENNEYVENILNDISWLGFKWGNIYYASDYFERLWDFAIWLIKKGLAYVDEQSSEEIAAQKGTPTEPGILSPYRDRPIQRQRRPDLRLPRPRRPPCPGAIGRQEEGVRRRQHQVAGVVLLRFRDGQERHHRRQDRRSCGDGQHGAHAHHLPSRATGRYPAHRQALQEAGPAHALERQNALR